MVVVVVVCVALYCGAWWCVCCGDALRSVAMLGSIVGCSSWLCFLKLEVRCDGKNRWRSNEPDAKIP